MIIKTRGIVLSARKYSETSLIVDIFTESKGLRSYIISGVRKKNSRISPSLLQILALVDLVVYHRDDKKLTRIKEITFAHLYETFPFDVRKSSVGMFVAEVISKCIVEAEAHQTLFDYLYDWLLELDSTTKSVTNFPLHFLTTFTQFLGLIPGGDYSTETPYFDLQEGVFTDEQHKSTYYLAPQESALLDQLLQTPLSQVHDLVIPKSSRKILLRQLLNFYQLHIERMDTINAHLVLEEVLGA